MKLTNPIREAFVRQAMDDVPQIDYAEAIRKVAMDAVLRALPPSVRKVYDDEATRPYLESCYRSFGKVSVSVPGISRYREADKPELPAKALTHITELAEKKEAQEATRAELQQKLKAAALSCSTRDGLAKLLPEFAKYLPADEPAAIRTLPVIANIVADFSKAGWPKGKKRSAASKVEA